MEEKRRSKRVPFNSTISVEALFSSGDEKVIPMNLDVIITDISNTGIGFISKTPLSEGNFFNCKLSVGVALIYGVLKIVRCDFIDNNYHIGSEFIGLANILKEYIDDYVEKK